MSSHTFPTSPSTFHPTFSSKYGGYKEIQQFIIGSICQLGTPFSAHNEDQDENISDTDSDYASSIISYRPDSEVSYSPEEKFYRMF